MNALRMVMGLGLLALAVPVVAAEHGAQMVDQAVSYTHLTLPTILLV